jgi:hypothetical protein
VINEKTLELNLTFEILTVADQLWSLIQFATSAPRVMHACHCFRPYRLPPHQRPPYALGLTLNDEKRQGWDVKIQLPSGPGRPTHALFLQFKQGEHKAYSTHKLSAFRGSVKSAKPFCEFEFNNNSDGTQHIVLRGLAAQPSLQGSVSYVFPRIPNAQTFKACLGRLIHVTTSHTVSEIDAQATAKGIIISAGQSHKFRTSYTSPFVTELCSDPKAVELDGGEEGDLFSDIVSIRVHRALTEWQEMLREAWHTVDFEQVNWSELFRTFQVELGRYLAVEPRFFADITGDELPGEDIEALGTSYREFSQFEEQLREHIEFSARNDNEREQLFPERRRNSLMSLVVKKTAHYKHLLASPEWLTTPIPQPETTFAIPVGNEMDLRLETLGGELSQDAFVRSLSSLSFQAI